MSYKVKAIIPFAKAVKKIAKKHKSIKFDVLDLISMLELDPAIGVSLGDDCYKVRLAIKSKGKGKSGGARIITCVKIVDNTVYLLTIYDKSEKSSISDKELKELLKYINS